MSKILIILDLKLPGMDGFEICKKLRQEKIDTPIIMFTSKTDCQSQKQTGGASVIPL